MAEETVALLTWASFCRPEKLTTMAPVAGLSARPEETVEDRPLAVSDAAGPHQLATAFGNSGGFRRRELDRRRRR